MKKIVLFLLSIFAITGPILTIRLITRYIREIRAAYNVLEISEHEVIETQCGLIEYAIRGEGKPVLVIHGIFGGFDQGIFTAGDKFGEGYMAIAPSRFGYLGTPLPDEPSVEAQADAYICLLDSLNIDKAVVFGTSAGGTSAIQFALRHPERVSALILNSSNAPGEVDAKLPPEAAMNIVFRSDFCFWLMTTYLKSPMQSMIGVPKGFELIPEYEEVVADVLKTILPVKPRAEGALFDMYVSNAHINTDYAWNELEIPVLIVNAKDDPMTLYENAKNLAKMIPNAKLITIESGGHLQLGNDAKVKAEIADFLDSF